MKLKDKVAFVTGSTRGIGWAVAQKFALEGAIVYINGVSDASMLSERVESLKSSIGQNCDGFFCSVTNRQELRKCYQEIFKKHKRLDVLVNNAGILEAGLLAMSSSESIDKMLDVNLKGVIYNMQYASRLMAQSKGGSIINVSSVLGKIGAEGLCVYSATKAAVIGLSYAAAKELAPQNIRVNAVAPGLIDTELARNGVSDEEFNQKLLSIRMGRLGMPAEVADAVCFLASDESKYVTGQVLGVDGGIIN